MKACKQCKTLFEGNRCIECGSEDVVDAFKGKVSILDPEQSEIAQNLKFRKKGLFALRLG